MGNLSGILVPKTDNIYEIIDNPNDVNCFSTFAGSKNKLSLVAHKTDGTVLHLSEEKHVMTFPFEPIRWLSEEYLGNDYFKDYRFVDILGSNQFCVNKRNFASFSYTKRPDNKFVDVTANFINGQSAYLFGVREKYFESKGKVGLQNIEKDIYSFQIENGIYDNAKIESSCTIDDDMTP